MRSAVLLLVASAFAQSPAFDVASVKPSPPAGDLLQINLGTFTHDEVTLTNATLSECIQFAYSLVSEDEIDGPDWIRDRNLRVDIVAKAPAGTSRDQALSMTQVLLAERFHLQLHRGSKPVRHLELTVARNGPKMPPTQDGAPARPNTYNRGRLFYDRRSMYSLALLLSRQLKEPVLDLTGLKGFFDVHLEWAPDDPAPMAAGAPAVDAAPLPGIYQAVEEQLGLHLESKKTPIEVIVVDHADRVPVSN